MKIFDLLPEHELDQQIADRMVKVQYHPSAPLAIANYTQVAQFNSEKWNHVTDICRGLIWNTETQEIVARPFVKFWNYNDPRHPETLPENLPTTEPEMTRKEDGSLGILFRNPLTGRWEVATRGSFSSEQAVWAERWLADFDRQDWGLGLTPLAEIIYPANRIVVNYGEWSGLKLLSIVCNDTGEELDRPQVEEWARNNHMEVVPLYNKRLSIAVDEDRENEEGYVAKWDRIGRPPLRVKIKFGTYRKLHKILTGTNSIGIWELLRDGKSTAAVFEHTPEEFKDWVAKTEASLLCSFHDIEKRAHELFATTESLRSDRKAFAQYATAQDFTYTALLFALLDRKDIAPIIWKTLRPTGNILPFKSDEE